MLPLRLVPFWTLELAFWVYLGFVWVRWFKRDGDPVVPRWRKAVVLAGFSLASFSVLLDIFMTVHAAITGGYSFYHPVELFCIRAGSRASLAGLLGGCLGKGKLRVPTFIASAVTLLIWFADAMAQ